MWIIPITTGIVAAGLTILNTNCPIICRSTSSLAGITRSAFSDLDRTLLFVNLYINVYIYILVAILNTPFS